MELKEKNRLKKLKSTRKQDKKQLIENENEEEEELNVFEFINQTLANKKSISFEKEKNVDSTKTTPVALSKNTKGLNIQVNNLINLNST